MRASERLVYFVLDKQASTKDVSCLSRGEHHTYNATPTFSLPWKTVLSGKPVFHATMGAKKKDASTWYLTRDSAMIGDGGNPPIRQMKS